MSRKYGWQVVVHEPWVCLAVVVDEAVGIVGSGCT